MNKDVIAITVGAVFLIGVVVLYFWAPKWLSSLGSAAAWAMRN